jgi:hypothetical protein
VNDLVWVVLDLNKQSKIMVVAHEVELALAAAASIVRNKSYAGPLGDIYLFGRGDGNTEVMVRQLPKEAALKDFAEGK